MKPQSFPLVMKLSTLDEQPLRGKKLYFSGAERICVTSLQGAKNPKNPGKGRMLPQQNFASCCGNLLG
jgi:hypothetical protein